MLNFVRSYFRHTRFRLSRPSSIGWVVLPVYVIALTGIVAVADLGVGTHPSTRGISSMVQSIPSGDKAGHFLLFGTLAFLANQAVARSGGSLAWHLRVTALVVVVVMAEEFSQIFLPYRNFDRMDLVADLAGIVLFSAFAYFWKRGKLAA